MKELLEKIFAYSIGAFIGTVTMMFILKLVGV